MIKKRYHFNMLDSTNKKAKELALEGCIEGTLITADAQSAGVGRRGRNWSSEKDAGIYMSMVLRPNIAPEEASMITIIAAVAVSKAVDEMTKDAQVITQIKWPNDIIMNRKKVCGILTELTLKQTDIDFLVVGIGINVTNESFYEEIKDTASSILVEAGQKIDKELLINEVWKHFLVYYQSFLEQKTLDFLKEEYENRMVNKNREVKVLDPAGVYTGIAKGITNKGELIVATASETKLVANGEVSVRGIYGYV